MRTRAARLARAQLDRLPLPLLGRNHDTQHPLDRHGMAAGTPVGKEAAITMPRALMEARRVGIVLTLESGFKLRELDALWLLCVLFGLGNLPNHARVHFGVPPLSCPAACLMRGRSVHHAGRDVATRERQVRALLVGRPPPQL